MNWNKKTFVRKWWCFQYTVIPFVLKNSLAIFSRKIGISFKELIHKFLEVYFDDWIAYGLIKKHIERLRITLYWCRQYHISLNFNKCILCVTFGILLGHVVCKQELLMDPTKISIIVDLTPPNLVWYMRTTLGHMINYRKFIKRYAHITTLMEELLKKEVMLQ